jgi:hypothetical protein
MSDHQGDFALLNPFPYLTNEDGEVHCPMPLMARSYEGDEETPTFTKALCGEPLAVVWTLYCPVPDPGDRIEDAKSAGEWAYASSWELQCGHGHVLLTSVDRYGSDDAQPFDVQALFGRTLGVSS